MTAATGPNVSSWYAGIPGLTFASRGCAGINGGCRFARCVCIARRRRAAIRVYDHAGNVIDTHEHAGDFKDW
jgi:hypothetical protein